MRRVRTHDPNVLKYRQGPSWAALIFVPGLVLAAAFAFGLLTAREDGWAVVVLLINAPLLLLFGRKACGCRGVVFDRGHGLVTTWRGLLVPLLVLPRQRSKAVSGLG